MAWEFEADQAFQAPCSRGESFWHWLADGIGFLHRPTGIGQATAAGLYSIDQASGTWPIFLIQSSAHCSLALKKHDPFMLKIIDPAIAHE